jgi:hypothetical protein
MRSREASEILVFANLIQIPAVILTGGAAWLVW